MDKHAKERRMIEPLMKYLPAIGVAVVVMLVTMNAIPGLGGLGKVFAGEQAVRLPAPTTDRPKQGAKGPQVAVIAGGCFWGVQGVYQHTKGVLNAVSGYAGGEAGTAHYDIVGSGRTGHAEAVEITYDPAQIS